MSYKNYYNHVGIVIVDRCCTSKLKYALRVLITFTIASKDNMTLVNV